MDNLENLGTHFSIEIQADEEGYTGLECPNEECKEYFKVILDEHENSSTTCQCPYCGQRADRDEYFTAEQIEYAESIVFRKYSDALNKDLKAMEFDVKPEGDLGIGLSLSVRPDPSPPIHHYEEKELETKIECGHCSLKYAVYGVFAFCPDCGQHNSLQILISNFDLFKKMLKLAEGLEPELAEKQIENALEDCVSAFDGFGREICKVHKTLSSKPEKATKITFQNLEIAAEQCLKLFNLDIKKGIDKDNWKGCIEQFQKRHLLAHKMGVADDKYVQSLVDKFNVKGRKVQITPENVTNLIEWLQKIAKGIVEHFENSTFSAKDSKEGT